MSGRARFERWKEKFEADFYRPAMMDLLRATLENIPPEQRRELARQNPEAYQRLMGKTGE